MQMLLIRTDSLGYSGCHEQRVHPIITTATYSPLPLPFTQTRGMPVNTVNLTVQPWTVTADDACQYVGVLSPPAPNESILSVFPNPVTDKLSLHFSEANHWPAILTVYNLLGAVIFSKNISCNDCELNLSFISQGTYVVEVRTDEWVGQRTIVKM
jgi:hypothetical protein